MLVSSLLVTVGGFIADVPVDPDAPEAQRLLVNELSKAEYQNAKPSWFDQIAAAIRDWFSSLSLGGVQGPPAFGLLLVIILLAVALIIAFLVFGVPRLNRRSAVSAELFGENDERTAAQIRAAAEAAAARGDFATAIAEMFRSIARGLAERTVVTTSPGTTARDFAVRAGAAFPGSAAELSAAGAIFDDVRYLGKDGSIEQYARVQRLEAQLRTARAELSDPVLS
jgi:Domain of unknown function (DUF4129)